MKHRGGIFDVPDNYLFIRASPTEAFCAPTADASKVSPSELAELLASHKTVGEWVDLLTMLEASEEELTLEALEGRMGFLDQARAHRTPVKPPLESPSAFRGDFDAILEEVPTEITRTSAYAWSADLPPDFVQGIELLGQSVNAIIAAIPTALSDTAVWVSKTEEKVGAVMDQLSARLLGLEGSIGRRPSDSPEDLPPTLWDSVASFWSDSESEDSKPRADRTSADPKAILGVEQKAERGRSALAEALRAHEDQATQLFKLFQAKLGEVVQAQNLLARDVRKLGSSAPAAATASPGLDSLLAAMGDGGSVPTPEKSELDSLKKEIEVLRRELKEVKGEESDESVNVGGVIFHTKDDLRAWMLEHAPDGPFGSFVDFASLLQQVDFDLNGSESNEDILKSLKLRSDLSLGSNSDFLALAALRNRIPPLFGRGKTPTSTDRSSFYAVHTFNDWKSANNRDGLTQRMAPFLEGAKRSISLDISLRLEPGSVASLLAIACLSAAMTFTQGFIKFVTETFEELVQAAFSKTKAWALASALGARICHEVHKDSGALLRSIRVTKSDADREDLCVLMLWATFRSHTIMAEYQRLEFKDHPTIASEYVKFLATNSGFEVVASLEAKMDSLNKELATTKKAATSAGNAAETAKNTASEAKKIAERALRQCPS